VETPASSSRKRDDSCVLVSGTKNSFLLRGKSFLLARKFRKGESEMRAIRFPDKAAADKGIPWIVNYGFLRSTRFRGVYEVPEYAPRLLEEKGVAFEEVDLEQLERERPIQDLPQSGQNRVTKRIITVSLNSPQ
jgi:hypothetical protein